MSAADFSRTSASPTRTARIVPPGRYISQRAFEEGGPLHYKIDARIRPAAASWWSPRPPPVCA